MKEGFYTALGTPFDENGVFSGTSFEKQIKDQIGAGASGLLIMGSMGIQSTIVASQYASIAKTGSLAAESACPVFVGVMDNSIARVMERIESLAGLPIDGVVATTPFYSREKKEAVLNFFKTIADRSRLPLYLYDLPAVTQNPLTTDDVKQLMKHPNIRGIKTPNMVIAREINSDPDRPDGFNIFFSDLDIADVAYKYGIRHNLDGMFACTPNISSKMYSSLKNGDYQQAKVCLDRILQLRIIFAKYSILPAFTEAMNYLGYEGRFHPDYHLVIPESGKAEIFSYIDKYEKGPEASE